MTFNWHQILEADGLLKLSYLKCAVFVSSVVGWLKQGFLFVVLVYLISKGDLGMFLFVCFVLEFFYFFVRNITQDAQNINMLRRGQGAKVLKVACSSSAQPHNFAFVQQIHNPKVNK